MTWGSWMVAIRRIRPLQRGQASTVQAFLAFAYRQFRFTLFRALPAAPSPPLRPRGVSVPKQVPVEKKLKRIRHEFRDVGPHKAGYQAEGADGGTSDDHRPYPSGCRSEQRRQANGNVAVSSREAQGDQDGDDTPDVRLGSRPFSISTKNGLDSPSVSSARRIPPSFP